MGVAPSKRCTAKHERLFKAKIRAMEEEMQQLRLVRDGEARAYEQHAVLFACREEEWKAESRKHREEAARLRRRLEEEQERARALAAAAAAADGGGEDKEVQRRSSGGGGECLVEYMKVEQARREEAVEKWKQLYHAIKTELDDLILRTRQGERYCWRAEQGIIEGLQRELRAKEEMLEVLRSRLSAMEKDAAKREREIDILRQSLRILSSTKRSRGRKNLPRNLRSRMI